MPRTKMYNACSCKFIRPYPYYARTYTPYYARTYTLYYTRTYAPYYAHTYAPYYARTYAPYYARTYTPYYARTYAPYYASISKMHVRTPLHLPSKSEIKGLRTYLFCIPAE